MKYDIIKTTRFTKDYKIVKKQGKDINLLLDVIHQLAEGYKLPVKFSDHKLEGNYSGYRECHIQPDWLLIYKISEEHLILTLTRTGSHSSLF